MQTRAITDAHGLPSPYAAEGLGRFPNCAISPSIAANRRSTACPPAGRAYDQPEVSSLQRSDGRVRRPGMLAHRRHAQPVSTQARFAQRLSRSAWCCCGVNRNSSSSSSANSVGGRRKKPRSFLSQLPRVVVLDRACRPSKPGPGTHIAEAALTGCGSPR